MTPVPSPTCHFSTQQLRFFHQIHRFFKFSCMCACLIWPSPTHQFLLTSDRIPSIFVAAQCLWANNPSPHRFSINFHQVSACPYTCLSANPPTFQLQSVWQPLHPHPSSFSVCLGLVPTMSIPICLGSLPSTNSVQAPSTPICLSVCLSGTCPQSMHCHHWVTFHAC